MNPPPNWPPYPLANGLWKDDDVPEWFKFSASDPDELLLLDVERADVTIS